MASNTKEKYKTQKHIIVQEMVQEVGNKHFFFEWYSQRVKIAGSTENFKSALAAFTILCVAEPAWV